MRNSKRKFDFSKPTKQIISARAGYCCSFPNCGRQLIGPGDGRNDVANLGEVGHIFSGSPEGPRFDSLLTSEQLCSPQNGIFLCRHHHGLVDALDSTYNVPKLIGIKDRHEYEISVALGGLNFPKNWIDSVSLCKILRFKPGSKMQLGRINHLYGDHGFGKTAVLEILSASLTSLPDPRWVRTRTPVELCISTKASIDRFVKVSIRGEEIRYSANGHSLPLFPDDYFVVFLKNNLEHHADDIEQIRRCYGLPIGILERLIERSNFKGLTTSSYSFQTVRTRPYRVREILVDIGNGDQQLFGTCSGSEKARVILDLGIAAATEVSRFRQVILLIDWVNIGSLDIERFEPYIDHLFSSQALFQTVFVSPDPINKLRWTGWQKIELKSDGQFIVICQ